MSLLLRKNLEILINKKYFLTDSKLILECMKNNIKKFKILVANRIQIIREKVDAKQWFEVPTKESSADDSSRHLKDVNSEKTKKWFEGPDFLWKSESEWPTQVSLDVDGSYPEVKATLTVNFSKIECDFLSKLEAKF